MKQGFRQETLQVRQLLPTLMETHLKGSSMEAADMEKEGTLGSMETCMKEIGSGI